MRGQTGIDAIDALERLDDRPLRPRDVDEDQDRCRHQGCGPGPKVNPGNAPGNA